jgi:hypothetical protein
VFSKFSVSVVNLLVLEQEIINKIRRVNEQNRFKRRKFFFDEN